MCWEKNGEKLRGLLGLNGRKPPFESALPSFWGGFKLFKGRFLMGRKAVPVLTRKSNLSPMTKIHPKFLCKELFEKNVRWDNVRKQNSPYPNSRWCKNWVPIF